MNNKSEYTVNAYEKLWKYLDFPKFLNMINFNELYLRRLDKFEDNFEGRAPEIISSYLLEETWNEIREEYEKRRKLRFIDCWTSFKDKESYAMWKIFSKEYGLAIETRAATLKKLLPSKAIIAKVHYIDFREKNESTLKDLSKVTQYFSAIKSIEYEYEKEVRIILPKESEETIISINMDMKKLINRVIISPYEDEWFYNLVSDILHNKYNYSSIDIIKSDIDVTF